LTQAREAWLSGLTGSEKLIELIRNVLANAASLGRPDYISLVDQETLQPQQIAHEHSLIALAVFFDRARLIDNIELSH
jgi:pantothenate synthetase